MEQNVKDIIDGTMQVGLQETNYKIMVRIIDLIFSREQYDILQIVNQMDTSEERFFFLNLPRRPCSG